MTSDAAQRVESFITKWQNSGGNEQANYVGFFLDLCAALGVESPPPKGNVADDPYCFEKGIKIYHPSGKVTDGRIDFYKADHFIIEAKQGSDQTGKGTAKRGTPSYLKAMEKAFVQAIAYTRNVPNKPPFLLTCDIGDHFELWTGFNGDYGGYAARRDIELAALRRPEIFAEFVDLFTDPQARNPEKIAAKVTREVAADLAELTKSLERLTSPAPLPPLPAGVREASPEEMGDQSRLPSPPGRRAGDEGSTAAINSPSPLTPLPAGEGNPELPSTPGRRAGDEGLTEEEGQWDGGFSRLAGRWRQIPDAYIEKARELRRNQTLAEQLLWELLRAKRFLGAKFRRQHKIDQFIADFYCHEARLVIELDGAVHDRQTLRDQDRDQWMQANGITVLRFRNAEVFDHTEAVLSAIAEVISPSPLTPLPAGVREASPEEMGDQSGLPSPPGRRAGDEGSTAAINSPSPLTPRPPGEGNRSDLPSPPGRRAGDEGMPEDQRSNHAQAVAHFLMRCIFTMFAEDVGLLKEKLFTTALKTRWLEHPTSFKPEVAALWQAMNEGGSFGFHGQLLRFNGGLFADPVAFDLSADQIQILLDAAERDWQNVEPAIFGTLLERALDTKERSKLGAHYTPRSYVERLVRPVVMEPLQAQWVVVQGEAKQQLGDDPTPAKKKKAIATLEAFLTELRHTRILDPACGTGNFLYVTLDLIKQLESEVLKRLEDITGQAQLRLDIDQVNPSQFLGIELNPRAAAIADLVIWIGYLQWHFRRFGDLPPVEPVLREYKNIENRDAVLAYEGREPDIDPATGQVRTRWGGRKLRHPVTGEEVPDPSDQIPIYRYLNARPAVWPEADYVVSNPPFLGTKRVREVLGDEYIDSLTQAYSVLPENIDYVMYWWNFSGQLLRSQKINGFGLITTNSIRQVRNRKVVNIHTHAKKNPLIISSAIPDHPWVDEGANVRISMTASKKTSILGKYGEVISEEEKETPEESAESIQVKWSDGLIFDDLTVGVDVTQSKPLQSNSNICHQGCKIAQSRRKKGDDWARGFLLRDEEVEQFIQTPESCQVIRKYLTGDDITGKLRNAYVIDFYGHSTESAQSVNALAYQRVVEQVKPHRDQSKDRLFREKWWLFGRPRPAMREAITGLKRYIATSEVSKHRFFVFVEPEFLADGTLFTFALEDAYDLGILSSQVHVVWTLRSGGTLEDRPRYNNTVCFDPFPFPDPTPEQKQKIRDLGERLDAHRKKVQADHPDITITGMYNLLTKLRAAEPFTDKDRDYNNRALISTLKQIHDQLDIAVLEAYGWEDLVPLLRPSPLAPLPAGVREASPEEMGDRLPSPAGRRAGDEGKSGDKGQSLDEHILERLVALNTERAEAERNGTIRWLRPDYQSPLSSGRGVGGEGQQQVLTGIAAPAETAIAPVEQQKFPTAFKDQLAAIRDLLRSQGGEWTVAQVKAQFKNASRKQKAIQDCLESLEELGAIACHTEADTPRWYIADLQKAA